MLAFVGFATLLGLLAFHTLVAGVATRFFRLRLATSWGWVLYTLVLTPMVLFVSTLVFTGFLGVGAGVDALVGLPVVLGAVIDYLYVPPPEEYELPDTQ
jgi:hypothetical protein